MKAATGTSVIGTDLTILGDRITIISKNKLQVDGDVRGSVHGKQVVITEEGSVVGMVAGTTAFGAASRLERQASGDDPSAGRHRT